MDKLKIDIDIKEDSNLGHKERRMKDSGIEWIGDIPEDWEIRKLGNIASLYIGNSIKDADKDNYIYPQDAIPYIATKDVGLNNRIDYKNGMYIKKNDKDFRRANEGSSLICIEGGSAGRKIARVSTESCFGNKLCCVDSRAISNNFLYYYLLSPSFNTGFNARITGLIPGVTLSELGEIEVVVPPKGNRQNIANFLNEKTSKIDHIIDQAKLSIEEYKNYKQSLITETVTKGLNPDVEMKDSGIEWIGEIPEHWEITKFKNITSKLTDGAHISPDTHNGEYYFISTVNIENGVINYDNALKTSNESYEYMLKTGCQPNYNDLLMSKDGTIGKMAIVKDGINFVVASSLLIISENQSSDINYIYYYLMSSIGENQIESYHKGAGLRRISIQNTGNIVISVPPLEEQKFMASFLEQKCSEIDNLISTKEKLIMELESYKKSLIFEVVTGKIEVQ